jgi:hypothetical protein
MDARGDQLGFPELFHHPLAVGKADRSNPVNRGLAHSLPVQQTKAVAADAVEVISHDAIASHEYNFVIGPTQGLSREATADAPGSYDDGFHGSASAPCATCAPPFTSL